MISKVWSSLPSQASVPYPRNPRISSSRAQRKVRSSFRIWAEQPSTTIATPGRGDIEWPGPGSPGSPHNRRSGGSRRRSRPPAHQGLVGHGSGVHQGLSGLRAGLHDPAGPKGQGQLHLLSRLACTTRSPPNPRPGEPRPWPWRWGRSRSPGRLPRTAVAFSTACTPMDRGSMRTAVRSSISSGTGKSWVSWATICSPQPPGRSRW